MTGMKDVEVVVAHSGRATLRVGDVFLKVDGDPANADIEVQAIGLAPVPTPTVLWREDPVLAIAAVPGRALGALGEPSTASPAAWAAAGAAIRTLHDAPLPPWPGPDLSDIRSKLDRECEWLLANAVLPADVIRLNRDIADAALRPYAPAFIHGDLQIAHVFVEHDEVVGIIDWSGASRGDAMFDVATVTLGHEEHLDDLLVGYGEGADREVIRAWWSLRSLNISRWLIEHGFDPNVRGCEFDVLRARAQER
ncbi:phosphotransferase family protein [Ruania zhangjianzhongii]|uniref:phosphotransferase family protein n=1 Tax=Ruania zhangjianzhongii TaxID=2603206 RepID=UPI001AEF5B50|nr:phosphotransferase [Ruania zhangjianzhongii]